MQAAPVSMQAPLSMQAPPARDILNHIAKNWAFLILQKNRRKHTEKIPTHTLL